jgi:hypothetical protein
MSKLRLRDGITGGEGADKVRSRLNGGQRVPLRVDVGTRTNEFVRALYNPARRRHREDDP